MHIRKKFPSGVKFLKAIFFPVIVPGFLALLLFGNTLFPEKGKILYGGDLLTQFYYWKGYLVENIRNGIIPFWNPYLFSGTPFLAHPSTAFFYPFTVIFLLFPLNEAFSIFYFLHFIIAGAGMYSLLRIYTGRISSSAGSAAFILGGFLSTRVFAGHVDILSTVVWIPWVIRSYILLMNKGKTRNLPASVLFLSLEILAGFTSIVVFTLEFIFIYTVGFFVINRIGIRQIISLLKQLTLSVLFATGITAVQWIPTYRFIHHSIRGSGLPYGLASWGSLPPSGLSLFWDPFNMVELSKIPYSFAGLNVANFFDYYNGKVIMLSIGTILVFIVFRLIFKGLVKRIVVLPGRDIWIFLAGIVFFIWLGFGGMASLSIYDLFYRFVPFYRNFRIPAQHLIMVSVLLPFVFAVLLDCIRSRILKTLIYILICLELFSFSNRLFILTKEPYPQANLVDAIKANPGEFRVMPVFSVVSPVLWSFPLNMPMNTRIFSTAGYDPMILSNYYDFIDFQVNRNKSSSLLYRNVEIPVPDTASSHIDSMNVKFLLFEYNNSPAKKDIDSGRYSLVQSTDLYKLYLNNNVKPRFFLENSCISGENSVNTVKYSPNEIVLNVITACDSLLRSSEVYYPEWRAEINGLNTKILLNNNTFRSINIPKGQHTVKYYYEWSNYQIGVFISAISIIILIFIYSKNYHIDKYSFHKKIKSI